MTGSQSVERFGIRSRVLSRPIVGGVAAAAILLVGLRITHLDFYRVTGDSMEPTARNGDLMLVSNGPFEPGRGEVVIIGLVGDGGHADDIIKRVIGLPGDRVELRDGSVYVNGEKLEEPYLSRDSITESGRSGSSWLLGPDEYFVLGDNRAHSSDSRYFGPFAGSTLIGRPIFRYWPLDRTGSPTQVGWHPRLFAGAITGAEEGSPAPGTRRTSPRSCRCSPQR